MPAMISAIQARHVRKWIQSEIYSWH